MYIYIINKRLKFRKVKLIKNYLKSIFTMQKWEYHQDLMKKLLKKSNNYIVKIENKLIII